MKKMQKAVALLLVFTFVIMSLAACGKKEASSTNTNSGTKDEVSTGTENKDNAGDAGDTATASEWTWPLAEQKELSIWLWWSNDYADDPNQLYGIQEIEKNTNVHVNWKTVLNQEAMEKFGLMMASGEYPDILRGADGYYTGGLVQACADGIIYDLTDLVPQYMPTYMALVNSSEKLQKDTVTDDGRRVGVYTIASNNGVIEGERVWGGLSYRGDWLDALGLPEPVTIDDWHTMLKAFKDNYPSCEAPLMIGAASGYDVSNSFLSAYGVLGEFYNDNGTVKYGPLEEGYKQWVQLFRDWYAEGLIDPNFISNDASFMGSGEYLGTGRAGAAANIWGFTADVYKTYGYTQDEGFFLRGATTPVMNAGDTPQIGFAMSELTKETLSVTTNCKDVELALRYLDYWFTEEAMWLDSLGIEGDSYVANGDGTYSLSQKLYDQVANGDYPTIGAALNMYTMNTSDFGLYNWAMFDPIYAGNRALEAYDYWNQSKYDLMLPPCMTMTEDETNAYNALYTSIKTLVQENTVKFITGAKSMDEYDAFVNDLRSYGIEECIGYKQAALDRYNAR